MDASGRLQPADLSSAPTSAGKVLDWSVAYSVPAALGALVAAIAPAIMATREVPALPLRGSVSDYWDVEPRYAFWLPFSLAALLLVVDGIVSVVSPNKKRFGRRYQNFFLGGFLALLTAFNKDNYPAIHYPATYFFFLLFAAVMAYGSLLGLTGRHVQGRNDVGNRQAEWVTGLVSMIFFLLMGAALIFWRLDWITFYFFEVYALVSFALHYVMSAANPFPYKEYEFSIDWLNSLLRRVWIMRSPG